LTLLTFLLLIIGFFLLNNTITGKVIGNIDNNYSYTKAICNESKYCQDHEIKCQGKNVISIVPLTGAVAQFSEDWEDPRANNEITKFCD